MVGEWDMNYWMIILSTVQVGSSSMKRNLLMLSNLSPELKSELDDQKIISGHLKEYLQVEEQVGCKITSNWYRGKTSQFFFKRQPGFNVNNFSTKHDLLKFVFVRHPLDRYVCLIWLSHYLYINLKLISFITLTTGSFLLTRTKSWHLNRQIGINTLSQFITWTTPSIVLCTWVRLISIECNAFINWHCVSVLKFAEQMHCNQQPITECGIEHHVRYLWGLASI